MRLLRGIERLLREVDEAVFPSSIYCLCCGSMIDSTRTYSLCDDCAGRLHWITGPTCAHCGKALEAHGIGGSSIRSGVLTERLCYDCLEVEHLFRKGFACLTYGLHERELMMDLKYAGKGFIAVKFGDILFDRIKEEIRQGYLSPEAFPVDLIVPVPISDERFQKRGYNQSALMARQLMRRWRDFVMDEKGAGHRLPLPLLKEDVLYRARKTRMLRSLSPAQRALELEGAFRVKEKRSAEIKNKRILLTDDIYTSGATANACSQALLEADAADIILLTLAIGGNRRPAL